MADLLHASTLAIVGALILDRLAHAVPSSEAYLDLLGHRTAVMGTAVHTRKG